MIIPSTFASGKTWNDSREFIEKKFQDIVIVSIAEADDKKATFSADTQMAEIMVVARRRENGSVEKASVTYANICRRPESMLEAFYFAREIARASVEEHDTSMYLGSENLIGHCTRNDAGFSGSIGLPDLTGTLDVDVLKSAIKISQGRLCLPRMHGDLDLPLVRLGDLGDRGIHHDLLRGRDGAFTPRKFDGGHVPSYPMLWWHDAESERCMTVVPDAYGEVRPNMEEKALNDWNKASSNLCISNGFRFNSQSLAACRTPDDTPVLGGRGWPNFRCHDLRHDYPLLLWLNSTLGLFAYWCVSPHQQRGRGGVTITIIPTIAALDVRKLSSSKLEQAKRIFEDFTTNDDGFLPANQAYDDQLRKDLDRALLVDLLGQPEDVMEPLDLFRMKWCSEPTVYGSKDSTSPHAQRQVDS